MRFSLTGVVIFMAAILCVAALIVHLFHHKTAGPGSHHLVVVLLNAKDRDGLRAALEEEEAPALKSLRIHGISMLNCCASSPWYPATVASMLTGKYPSEHGLTRAHAFLSPEAKTLAEDLRDHGYKTFAAVGKGSLLWNTNILQGITFVEKTDPKETIAALKAFMDRLPGYRRLFALVEVDLDAFGGPAIAAKIVDILYDELGRERFLENGVLVVAAPSVVKDAADPRFPFIISGTPLKMAGGKVLLKSISAVDLEATFESVIEDRGFNIRDAARTGALVITETVSLKSDLPVTDLLQPPPHFFRAVRFDDQSCRYLLAPGEEARILDQEGKAMEDDPDLQKLFSSRLQTFYEAHSPVNDQNIPQTAGPELTEGLARTLGEPWNRRELMGHSLHAVEHFRLGEGLRDTGYAALAVNELNKALIMDPDFPSALFTLAQVYASIDPEGAKKHYRTFIERFGNLQAYAQEAIQARRFLGLSASDR